MRNGILYKSMPWNNKIYAVQWYADSKVWWISAEIFNFSAQTN